MFKKFFYSFISSRLFLWAGICFSALKCQKFFLSFLPFLALLMVQLFFFLAPKCYKLVLIFVPISASVFVQVLGFQRQNVLKLFFLFTNFSRVLSVIICFIDSKFSQLVTKCSKFVLTFSPISVSFPLQLFVFDLQKVVNLFRFFYQFKPRSLCSNIFLASRCSEFFLIFLTISATFSLSLSLFQPQNVLNLFLFLYQFQALSLCRYLFFSLKMLEIFSQFSTIFSFADGAVIFLFSSKML